jgi:uncharacterized repeat protein (TIGR02543 family)
MKFLAKSITVLILLIAVIACGDNLKPNGTTPNTTAATYTVTFDSQFNNIESTTTLPSRTSVTVNPEDTVGTLFPSDPKMQDPITLEEKYKFGGWWTGKGGTGIHFTASTKVTSDIIVYAYWYKYKVTYQSDSTTVIAITMITTSTVEALPTTPTKTGYTFVGWWTAVNGGGTQFFADTQVTGDTIVYAKWFQNTTPVTSIYAVTYNGNGGTDVGTQYVIAPQKIVDALPTPYPTWQSYKFKNWNTKADGTGNTFDTSTDVTSIADSTTKALTVYAQWTADPEYIVTYNSGWGSVVEAQHVILSSGNTVATGTAERSLPTQPTKRCYAFGGWYKDKTHTTPFTESTTVTADITVYAKWDWDYPSTTYPLISKPFTIGDPGPSCVGKVFYIDGGGLSGPNGLEMAPPGWSDAYAENGDPSAPWIYGGTTDDGNGGTYQKTQTTLNGNTSTGIGTYSAPIGLANSEAIIKQVDSTPPYAAKLCLDYSVGEGGYIFDNWFLPSKDELAQLYAQKDVQRWGGFVEERYWSSSEYDANDGWSQYFTTGAQQGTYKSYEMMVRPVRAF